MIRGAASALRRHCAATPPDARGAQRTPAGATRSRNGRGVAAAFAVVLAVAALALLAPPAPAREIAIERFDADLVVQPNGVLDVTERIRFRFTGEWNGVIRDIPVDYRTPQGFSFHLELQPVAITDGDGAPLKYESSRVRHYRELKIWVPGAVDAARDVVIRYRVPNALRFFDEHDELYWNVTGDEWEMPIERATARVVLPDRAAGVRTTVFTGAFGSRAQDADVRIDGNVVRFELRRALAFREGLTAVVGWDKGAVSPPSAAAGVLRFVLANLVLLVPVGVFFAMLSAWRRWGRDPAAQPVTVQYDPPARLTPAECGTLLDHRLDPRDITATVVDLAVRGYLKIEEVEKTVLLAFRSRDYAFTMVKPHESWTAELKTHEWQVLTGLFKGGSRPRVELSDLKNEFYVNLKPMRDGVYDALIGHGFYSRRPDHAARGWMIAGAVIAFTSGHGAAFIAAPLGIPFVTWLVAQLASGLIVIAFGWVMPARTENGARAAESVRGFEEFLGRVEGDRIERVVRTPEMFEKFLPYAMAFGVEDRWAGAFADIVTTPPTWYQGAPGRTFHPGSFTHSLGQFSSQAATSMSSSPRSSGGSGFGGGSSGGGGGGGGGRGF